MLIAILLNKATFLMSMPGTLKKTENASPKCIFCLMFYFTLVLGMIIGVEAGFVVVNVPSALTS